MSFLIGPTERRFLSNSEDIVQRSLPVEKAMQYFKEAGPDASLDFLKGKCVFAVNMAKVSLDQENNVQYDLQNS